MLFLSHAVWITTAVLPLAFRDDLTASKFPSSPFAHVIQTCQKRLSCRSKRSTTSRLRRSRIVLFLCRRRRHHVRSRRSRCTVRARIQELKLDCTVIFAENDPGGVLHDVFGTYVRVYRHVRRTGLVVCVLVVAHRRMFRFLFPLGILDREN